MAQPAIIYNFLYCFLTMDNDIVIFLASFGVLILYLVFSAMTEMGTKFPWKK
jgi:hypothetical protein